jgi:hypothetical protein
LCAGQLKNGYRTMIVLKGEDDGLSNSGASEGEQMMFRLSRTRGNKNRTHKDRVIVERAFVPDISVSNFRSSAFPCFGLRAVHRA